VSASDEPAAVRHFESVSVGDELTELTRGPMSEAHLMRWSAAIENWHRIHYDEPFATKHDGLPCLLVNGTWKQNFLIQMVTGGSQCCAPARGPRRPGLCRSSRG
jgi:hydroxyacyl-ACP dehydratase HTD2-like protein with hotdog domain